MLSGPTPGYAYRHKGAKWHLVATVKGRDVITQCDRKLQREPNDDHGWLVHPNTDETACRQCWPSPEGEPANA